MTFNIGAGSGGLWGKPALFFLFPLSDQLSALTTGSVAVNPFNADIIFLGTGEYNRRPGTGLYRTTNGGSAWTQMSLSVAPQGVARVLIAPWNDNIVFCVGDAGIYKSTNSGDSWSRVTTWNACDIASSPGGTVMLAGRYGVGVYRSTNQGDNWTQLTSGLPSSNVQRIVLAIAPSNFTRAYVQMSGSNNAILGVYRSDDDNATTPSWTNITPSISYMPNQGWIHNALGIKKNNSNIVWVGGVNLLRSTDAGSSWAEKGTNTGQVHGDIHVIYYRSGDNLLYIGSDGGIFSSDDDGENWSSLLNSVLPITQFYNVHVSKNEERVKYGGAQDNGTSGTSISAPNSWVYSKGGDGCDVVVDWSDATKIYAGDGAYAPFPPGYWRRVKTTNSGGNWNSINSGIGTNENTPWASIYIEQDPAASSWLYANASNYFYYTSNGGNSWQRMSTSALSGNSKHVSANSTGSFIYGCTDNLPQRLMGYSYTSSSSPPWTQSNISSGLANKEVKRVSPSLTNSSRAYSLMTGIGDAQKVYKTTDNGKSWTNITKDLPDIAVNDVVENPNNANVLYLATQAGAYKSANGGTSWYRWNSGMPEAIIITDLEYVFSGSGDYLLAGTFGRSTFERKATGSDAIFSLSTAVLNFGSLIGFTTRTESLYVKNRGEAPLSISEVRLRSPYFYVYPSSAMIASQDCVWFHVNYYNPQSGEPGKIGADMEFVHDGDGSPATVSVAGYVGDGTTFRSFEPESLIVKKEIKRKTAFDSWCFDFTNAAQPGDPAEALHAEFKQPVESIDAYSPFQMATKIDAKGLSWDFTNGFVAYGRTMTLCGRTKKKKLQQVVRWSWTIMNESHESFVDSHGSLLPTSESPGLVMPNTANFRKEIFEQVPFTKDKPLVVGIPDPGAKNKKIAYVTFAKHGDLYGSLTPGKSGKRHSGPPRCFDFFDNRKEMIGVIKKLTPDMQNNRLFAELVALKLNIYGSRMIKTPIGFGELKYVDPNSHLNGLMIKQIDSLANIYMTYCDSSAIGSAVELDSVVRKINAAFSGPLDTISFASKLELTGMKPIAEVPFLERDPSIIPSTIVPTSLLADAPEQFALYQNYPNPFNPLTVISYSISEPSIVTLKVYNILGQEVVTLLDREEVDEGNQEVEFNASSLPSGVYFYRIAAQSLADEDEESVGQRFISVKKMILLR